MNWASINQYRIDRDREDGRRYWAVRRDINHPVATQANALWARMQTEAPQLFVECVGWTGEQIEALEYTWSDNQGRAWFGKSGKVYAIQGSGEECWIIVPEYGPVDFRTLETPPAPLVKIARAMEDKLARMRPKKVAA